MQAAIVPAGQDEHECAVRNRIVPGEPFSEREGSTRIKGSSMDWRRLNGAELTSSHSPLVVRLGSISRAEVRKVCGLRFE